MTRRPKISSARPNLKPAPKDLQLENGYWCSMDRSGLVVERHGWVCPSCRARWDHRGLHGEWVAAGNKLDGGLYQVIDLGERLGPAATRWRRFDRAAAVMVPGGVVLGLGVAAGREWAAEVSNPLVWAVIGLLLLGAGLLLAWRWWAGRWPVGWARRGAGA